MGRPVQGHPIWFLPSIPCCISTYSRCQVLRSVAMNITWNGTEQSCFLPGCTYIYWKTAILKVSRELLCFALHWAVKLGTGCFRAFLMPCVGAGAAVSGSYWSELTTAPKPGVFLPSDWESLLRSKQAFEENPQGVWGRPSVYSSSTVLSFLVTWLRMLTSLKFHPNQLTPKFNINLATFCFSASMITNPPPQHPPPSMQCLFPAFHLWPFSKSETLNPSEQLWEKSTGILWRAIKQLWKILWPRSLAL